MTNLDKQLLDTFIKQALAEDIGDGDHTSLATIPKGAQGKAKLLIKDEGIFAGIQIAKSIFNTVDATLEIDVFIKDGDKVSYGDIALFVKGNIYSILTAERLVLNTLQRLSGIATTTNKIAEKLKLTKTKVLDTRKTTPNIRFLEKWAVKVGGGVNHRFGLYDMILIKDNHVDYAGGISNALKAAKHYTIHTKMLPIEIEVRNLNELKEVLLEGGVERILLDNFNYEDLKLAVKLIDGRFTTEASGGITEQNALEFAKCGVDYISMGALTHSVKSLDMSLKATFI